jgi:hypothetical protein
MKKPAANAHVRSLEAIDAFRATLIIYGSKARPLLEDAWEEVARTREWIQTDRRRYWENEVRKRKRALDDAEQALFSARFSTLRPVRAAEQQAAHRAKRALVEAEEKLAKVRHWSVEFDNTAGPLLKHLEELRTHLTTDLTKAAGHLGNVIRALEAYAEVASVASRTEPGSLTPAASPGEIKPEPSVDT